MYEALIGLIPHGVEWVACTEYSYLHDKNLSSAASQISMHDRGPDPANPITTSTQWHWPTTFLPKARSSSTSTISLVEIRARFPSPSMTSDSEAPSGTPSFKRRKTDGSSSPRSASPPASGVTTRRVDAHDGERDSEARRRDASADDWPISRSQSDNGSDAQYRSPGRAQSRSPSPRQRPRSRRSSRTSSGSQSRLHSQSRSPTRSPRSLHRSRSESSSDRTRSESYPAKPQDTSPLHESLKPNYQPKLVLHGHTKPVSQVRISPNGRFIASASADATLKIWDAATGAHMDTLVGHMAGVSCVAWGPDNNTLATGSDDKSIRLWDRVTGRPKTTTRKSMAGQDMPPLRGHHNYVYSLAFSPKGNILASGSYDEAVFLWDVRAGRLMRSLPAHSDPVGGVDFCCDGTLVVSCSTDGLM